MARASKSPVAGGALIALAVIIGVTIGLDVGQPTQGFLIGTAIGIGMAVAVWLIDRRRQPLQPPPFQGGAGGECRAHASTRRQPSPMHSRHTTATPLPNPF